MAELQAIFCAANLQVGDHVGTLLLLSTYMQQTNTKSRRFWVCRCVVCGLERPVYAHSLKGFVGKPCKCTNGWSQKREYGIWQTMLSRCYNAKTISFPSYGAVGVFVCERWRTSSNAFLVDMGDAPTTEHSIDRIESSGGYTCGKCDECKQNGYPANCRWATKDVQARNQKSNRYYTHDGKTLILTDWAKLVGISFDTLCSRIDVCGWTFEKAITSPLGKTGRRRSAKQKPSSTKPE